jgi:hypothetical protein
MPNDLDGSGRAQPLSTGQSCTVYLLAVTALSVAIASLYWRTKGSLPGGQTTAKKRTPEQRKDSARKAAVVRWEQWRKAHPND